MKSTTFKLNTEQEELKYKLIDFIYGNKYGYYGVLGAGGTGKTTVVCNVLSKVINMDVVFLGATNKVTTVLKKSLKKNGMKNPKIKTIDSFLGFKIIKDHKNKSIITYDLPKKTPSIIVIDEISMITFQKFEQIEKFAKETKIILLGDNLQIPPIEEEYENKIRDKDGFLISRIFEKLNSNNSFTLTIQNRQKDGTDLSKLINGFRLNMSKKMNPKFIAQKKNNGKDILFYKINDKELKEFIKQNDSVAVCYKNLTVLSFNWLVGSTKSMEKNYLLSEINIGDKVMFDQFYFHLDNGKKTSFYTSNIVEVIDIKKNCNEEFMVKQTITKTITKTITYTELTVIYDNKKYIIRYVPGGLYGDNGGGVSRSVYGQRMTFLKHIEEGNDSTGEIKIFLKDLNTRFSDYQNSFAKLKKPYAITCHKAQGSTYTNVIIPVYDFFSLDYQDANQLLYVAMSRAEKKIVFVDRDEHFLDNSKRYCFSEFEKISICSNYEYKCSECKIDLAEREFDIDHKIPISKGGKNNVENLQPLCKNCHKNKTALEK